MKYKVGQVVKLYKEPECDICGKHYVGFDFGFIFDTNSNDCIYNTKHTYIVAVAAQNKFYSFLPFGMEEEDIKSVYKDGTTFELKYGYEDHICTATVKDGILVSDSDRCRIDFYKSRYDIPRLIKIMNDTIINIGTDSDNVLDRIYDILK